MKTAQCRALISPTRVLPFVVLMLAAAGYAAHAGGTVNVKESQEGASQNLNDYPGLVRVVIYGLTVFDFGADPPKGTMPDGARVLFAKAHGHKLKVWHGKESRRGGKFRLKALDYEFDTGVSEVDNVSIEFQGALEPNLSASVGDFEIENFPNQEQARDVRWMMRAINMDGFRNLRGGSVQATLRMPRGRIETCGLVHPPNIFDLACNVIAPRMGNARAASEYMLFTFTVKSDVTDLKMVVRRAGEEEIITFPPTEERPVGLGDYSRLFDLVMGNLGPQSLRGVQSNHANHLKALFVNPAGEWEVSVPGCRRQGDDWDCGLGKCVKGIQPSCLGDFEKRYVNWKEKAGNNRPICPMVEYP